VPLVTWAKDERNDLFPAICNAKKGWLDELPWSPSTRTRVSLSGGVNPAASCSFSRPTRPRPTVNAGSPRGVQAVTGAELERQRPEEAVKATAWNNRLKTCMRNGFCGENDGAASKFTAPS